MTRNQADKKDLTVEFLPEEALPSVYADPYRVTQILSNLLSNAVKFTPAGGTVTVTARRVHGSLFTVHGESSPFREPSTVNCERDRDFVEVSVHDTGIGILPENQAKLFQPFERLETSLGKRYEGTGLGLAIAKCLVEMHEGQIWVESQGEEKGSTFTFTLPVADRPGAVETSS
jgi:signal transduction histidine kinase